MRELMDLVKEEERGGKGRVTKGGEWRWAEKKERD